MPDDGDTSLRSRISSSGQNFGRRPHERTGFSRPGLLARPPQEPTTPKAFVPHGSRRALSAITLVPFPARLDDAVAS